MTANRKQTVIWDMDGVITDTAPYHFRAWQEVFRKRDKSYTEADFRNNFGKRNDAIIRNILGSQVSAEEMEAITTEKEVWLFSGNRVVSPDREYQAGYPRVRHRELLSGHCLRWRGSGG
ncbi:MAG: HAD family phosphatase [Dehalococcoidia bacterium]